MTHLTIQDLSYGDDLDQQALEAVRGGALEDYFNMNAIGQGAAGGNASTNVSTTGNSLVSVIVAPALNINPQVMIANIFDGDIATIVANATANVA